MAPLSFSFSPIFVYSAFICFVSLCSLLLLFFWMYVCNKVLTNRFERHGLSVFIDECLLGILSINIKKFFSLQLFGQVLLVYRLFVVGIILIPCPISKILYMLSVTVLANTQALHALAFISLVGAFRIWSGTGRFGSFAITSLTLL